MAAATSSSLSIGSTVVLNNGLHMPRFGLGTWRSDKGLVQAAVEHAIKAGYRHIDAAWIYQNQTEVGNAVEKVLKEGVVQRSDLFITSKLWVTHLNPKRAESQMLEILKDLKLSYLDLLLIHWPVPLQHIEGTHADRLFGKDVNGVRQHDNEVKLTDTWAVMESFVQRGLVKSIGLSNFSAEETAVILRSAKIAPVVNQVESHAYLQQRALREYCAKNNIFLTAYSLLGNMDQNNPEKLSASPLSDPVVQTLAKKYHKSPAQLLIRLQLQLGHIAIPKSTTKSRIEENANVFDFAISDEDMLTLEKLDKNHRFINPPFRPGDANVFPN